jgi:NAD(P)-dependent dehydrogenase (short-subunit alcohol dehydrogenase family)
VTVAVVTGAASGMGQACVARLRDLADVLVLADLEAPEVSGAVGVACDVCDPDSVLRLVSATRQHGPLRALVHAAGISPTMADARRILDVDLVGTQRLLDAFEQHVVPGTAAVCFASSAAHQVAAYVTPEQEALLADPLGPDFLERAVDAVGGDPGLAYALAKVGVVRAATRAAVRWGPLGGRVCSVSPGLIDTPMGRQELEQQPAMAGMLEGTPLGRLGRAEEVAAVVAFLVSEEASFTTGIDVLVDGGMVPGSTT